MIKILSELNSHVNRCLFIATLLSKQLVVANNKCLIIN